MKRFVFLILIAGCMPALQAVPFKIIKDIPFAKVGHRQLALDLYLPQGDMQDGLLVWVHGGAWRAGSKDRIPVKALVEKGWAVASVDYRLSGEVGFPAQIHDIKASIRFLRANAQEFGYPVSRIILIGSSAGGHLVALAGVTNGHPELEGTVGDHLDQSSDVQGIISLYGASNLTTILTQSTPHGLSVRVPALELFIGGQPDDVPGTAQLASPVFHVDAHDPPLLLIHGDQDPQMPINQSHELEGLYEKFGLKVEFVVLHGAKHGGSMFYDEERIQLMDRFLRNL